jgi:hypothetical protein
VCYWSLCIEIDLREKMAHKLLEDMLYYVQYLQNVYTSNPSSYREIVWQAV